MIIIDRFEGRYAVCEDDDKMVNIPREDIPREAREGDVIVKSGGRYKVDAAATRERKKEIEGLMDDLFDK